ncbi:PWP1 homolog no child left behind [Arctopsyche grandis]|uniref:PWP1 homolog no child left behind n=1 Tax=Arctopsyche grandis TaxID=121162 RepID=UPI00406D781B
MEESDNANIGLVSCVHFVRRGVAKANPEKVELTEQELQSIIQQTTEDLRIEEENSDDNDMNESEIPPQNPNDEFDLSNYDKEEVDTSKVLGIGSLATFAQDGDLEGVHIKTDDPDSDAEDDIIKTTDNLVLVGHVQGDASVLEVYVYNEQEGSLYVHHDTLLPSFPLCIEWLNKDPTDETPGNLCAIGSMDPIIQVWDLDIIDCLEPAFKLGRKRNRKKNINHMGHRDSVLDLAWNSNFDHILASASVDKTVLLWDLDQGEPHTKLKMFTDKVQSIKWHPYESQSLLSGCSDGYARVSDCRTTDAHRAWSLSVEIEKVCWDPLKPFYFAVSSSNGRVIYIDCRQDEPVWNLEAHEGEVTGLSLSHKCPGLMVTSSNEGNLKVWDVSTSQPELIAEKALAIGAAQCLSSCPENPFVFAAGGDFKAKNFGVWDVTKMETVMQRFGSRQQVGMAVNS